MARQHLPALDGLRAVAVFTVIAYHANLTPGIPGDLGVTLFFVLSGFLITWLLLREADATGTVSFRAFYRKRTLRIFPAYYAFVLAGLTVDVTLHHPWSPGLIAAALGYGVNYYNAFLGHPTTSVAHAWSLAVEEQFYLLWPVVFLALWRRGRRALRLGIAGVLATTVLWRSILTLVLHAPHSYVYNAFETRADALAIGCLLAVSYEHPLYERLAGAARRFVWLPFVTLGLLLASRVGRPPGYHYSIGMTVDAVLLVIFMVQVLGLSSVTRVWGWLDHPVARWLGLVSYPCYLWHGWGLAIGEHLARGGPSWLAFALGYGSTLALASGSYYLLERPFLALKNRDREQPLPRPSPALPLVENSASVAPAP